MPRDRSASEAVEVGPRPLGCGQHQRVVAPCCPVCLIEERNRLREERDEALNVLKEIEKVSDVAAPHPVRDNRPQVMARMFLHRRGLPGPTVVAPKADLEAAEERIRTLEAMLPDPDDDAACEAERRHVGTVKHPEREDPTP